MDAQEREESVAHEGAQQRGSCHTFHLSVYLFFFFFFVQCPFTSSPPDKSGIEVRCVTPGGLSFFIAQVTFFPLKMLSFASTDGQLHSVRKKRKKGKRSKVFSTGVSHSMGLRLTYTLKLEIPAQTQICFQHMSRHGSLSV